MPPAGVEQFRERLALPNFLVISRLRWDIAAKTERNRHDIFPLNLNADRRLSLRLLKEMTVKNEAASSNAIQQAELILHLYELRRETVMREARSYVGGEFMPASADEFVQIVSAGGKLTGFVLQVYGYWDMVSAFVLDGALSESLVYSTCQEMYFQYAKIQPFLAE